MDVVLLDVAFERPDERLLPAKHVGEHRRRRLQGVEILAHLRRARGDLPVVLMTSEEELAFEDAAEALAVDELITLAGADAFDARALGLLVERILARRRASPEGGAYTWGSSPAMARIRREAAVLARTSLPILVLGETGTGKSALAERVIHPATRREGAFVAVDLSALPASLMAAELFGTARGAFSGAVDRRGRFEEAHGGTLFLDEIGNLPAEAQRMLLLALQDGRITRLGESTPRAVDVKVVAATNADLEAKVREGSFRADLFARLNPAARLIVPPLRERRADIPELLGAFVRKKLAAGPDRALLADYMESAGVNGPPRAELSIGTPEPGPGVRFVLSRGSVAELSEHAWPGNVRELELFVANAAIFALADAVGAAERGRAAGDPRTIPIPAKLVRDLLPAHRPAEEGVTERGGFEVRPRAALRDVARDLERQLYEWLFRETDGDFQRMAERLLEGTDPSAGRKVRLRFNQLGPERQGLEAPLMVRRARDARARPDAGVASRRRYARASNLAGSGRARCASATRRRRRLPAKTRARRVSPGAGARDARARPDAGVASRRRRARASSLAGSGRAGCASATRCRGRLPAETRACVESRRERARGMRERDPMPGSPPGGDARAHRDRPASRIRDARTRPARGSPPIPGARAHDEGEATPMNRAPDQDSSGRGAGTARGSPLRGDRDTESGDRVAIITRAPGGLPRRAPEPRDVRGGNRDRMAERDGAQLWLGPTRRCRVSPRRNGPQMGPIPPAKRVAISAEHIWTAVSRWPSWPAIGGMVTGDGEAGRGRADALSERAGVGVEEGGPRRGGGGADGRVRLWRQRRGAAAGRRRGLRHRRADGASHGRGPGLRDRAADGAAHGRGPRLRRRAADGASSRRGRVRRGRCGR